MPAHLAERHGLIIIIALGESIVAVGVGAAGLDLDAGSSSPRCWAWSSRAAMWWAYFDFVALAAARRLRTAPPDERVRIARDSFTYLHMPMVTGIILFAVGAKKTLAHIDEHLDAVPAVALCGGAALYLVALSAFKRRNLGSWNGPRLVAASALAVLAPIATAIPALAWRWRWWRSVGRALDRRYETRRGTPGTARLAAFGHRCVARGTCAA